MQIARTQYEDRTINSEVKVYYDLLLPKSSPAPIVIALHGYGSNKRQMMREAQQMSPANFAIVSLQGFHQHLKEAKEPGGPLRFGFGWLTNFHPEDSIKIHHEGLLSLIANLIQDDVADPQKIFLLGFSQSCALNYRFAFTHPHLLRGVIGMCGGIPGDWETSNLYKPTSASILHLAGKQDEYYPPTRVDDYDDRLRLRARHVELRFHEGEHEITNSMREDVREWLKERASD